MAIKLILCSECKSDVGLDDLFCQDCGEKVNRKGRRQANLKSSSAQRLSKRQIGIVTGAVVLIGLFALVILSSKTAEKARLLPTTTLRQAKDALIEHDLDRAIQILAKGAVAASGNLNCEERSLLNDALFKRAALYAANENYQCALDDLHRITPEYIEYAQAGRMIANYQKLKEPVAVAKRQAAIATSATAKLPDPKPKTTQEHRTEYIVNAASQTDKLDQVSIPGSKYNDQDMVYYNRLLAGYFSKFHLGTISGANGMASPLSPEPPSYKEWLEEGKHDF